MNDRPVSVAFDRIASSYDASRGGEQRGREYATAIEPLLGPGRPVLEIGVGTGLVAAALTAAGRDVVGVDLSMPMLRMAAARLPRRSAQADALRLPVPDRSVAAVALVWVLHLVSDVEAVLREVGRVLRPGGRAVAVCSPTRPLEDPVSEVLDELYRELTGAARRDTGARLADLAPRCGLELVSVHDDLLRPESLDPAEAAGRVRSRSYSMLWDIDEAAWARAVEPALERLDALVAGPYEPGSGGNVNDVVVLARGLSETGDDKRQATDHHPGRRNVSVER